jgi:DUF917 family protein
MKKLNSIDLDDLLVGSAVLGSGGGGDPYYDYIKAKAQIEKTGPVSMISCAELKDDDMIAPLGFMGAPLAHHEKLSSGNEFIKIIKQVEEHFSKKVSVVMSMENAGANAFCPVLVASQLGIPMLDADMQGRAFPELQMNTLALANHSCSPGFLCDCLGNIATIYPEDSHKLEKIARQVTLSMGSYCAYCLFPLSGKQARQHTFDKGMSKAMAIGKAHRLAHSAGKDPVEAIMDACKGIKLVSGIITDIDRTMANGFILGAVTITNDKERYEVSFQNEFLVARDKDGVVASTPDLLTILENGTGLPVATDTIQYGLSVSLIGIPAPEVWTKPKGLALVGPRYFGYEIDYHPINQRR